MTFSLRILDLILADYGYSNFLREEGNSAYVPDLGVVDVEKAENNGYDSYGGSADGPCWVVLRLLDGRYVKKTGYSSSYDGIDWDGQLTEVTPVTKTVTVWE